MRGPTVLFGLMAILFAGACVHRFSSVEVASVTASEDVVTVRSPVKAHLKDGSVVVFRNGVTVHRDTLRGAGVRYDLRLAEQGEVPWLTLDQVVGVESYQERVDGATSAAVSVLATVGTAALAVGGIVAIACIADPKCFGSAMQAMAQIGRGHD